MRFRYCRSRCKLINNVLQRNKLLMFAFLCSCVYSLVLGRLLYQQTFMNPDLSTPTKFTGPSVQIPKSTKTDLKFATFLPILDAFNPFVLQTFSRNLYQQLSCRGDTYGVLRKRRLYLSGGHFQELSYRGLERNKTKAKVYVVGETADKNGITLGKVGSGKNPAITINISPLHFQTAIQICSNSKLQMTYEIYRFNLVIRPSNRKLCFPLKNEHLWSAQCYQSKNYSRITKPGRIYTEIWLYSPE